MPLEADNTGVIRLTVDDHDLGVITSDEKRMDENLAETAGQTFVGLCIKMLIAKKHYAMLQQRLANLENDFVAQV